MRGYLHRLVHTVSRPRETVHPRTGSLFAPYRSAPGSPSEWLEQSETVTTHPARPESYTTGESPGPARSGNSQSPLLFGTADEPPRLFEAGRRADASRPASNEAQHNAFENAVDVPPRLATPQAQRAVPDSRREAGGESHELLIHPPRSARPENPRFSTEAGSKREARANLPAEGRPARAERQPDEIQIHIGRIEVTAVQPPLPRAPKAPDKAISLDAYLERRNRRSR
jgi:hypothetical protein